MFKQRLIDITYLQNSGLLTVPLTFGMFLLGAYGWQKGWLGHFCYGPFEWIWRTLTYGKRQPMKRNSKITI